MVAVMMAVVVAATASKVCESNSSGGSDRSGGSAEFNPPIMQKRNAVHVEVECKR